MAKKNKSNLIILIFIAILLFLLLLVLLTLNNITSLEDGNNVNNSVTVSTSESNKKIKTIKEIIEESDSVYLGESGTITHTALVNFKYDLFDENGKSKKDFFYKIIEEIEEIENRTFYLNDDEKDIKVSAIYNPEDKTYRVLINGVEDYYNTVDGEVYIELSKAEEIQYSDLLIQNELIRKIGTNSSYYVNTELVTDEKEELENGYYSYSGGAIIARLQSGKVLNIVFRDGYEDSFASGIYVKTDLNTILEKYPNPNFGSIRERYLGYITKFAYIFFYDNEVSVYPFEYKENTYFDEYITEFCKNGNFDTLVTNFTENWTSYFEKEYDEGTGSFKITFPTRGIKIDIVNKNPKGITLYNNYYLTESMKDLIKAKVITLEADQDLVDITEKARHDAM